MLTKKDKNKILSVVLKSELIFQLISNSLNIGVFVKKITKFAFFVIFLIKNVLH